MIILEALSKIRTEYLDIFFRGVSYLGEITVLLPLLCVIFWCVNKSLAYNALFSYFLSGCVVQGAKIVFRIPRPWILNPNFKPVESSLATATGYSFPSGHVQGNTSIFLAIAKWSGHRFLSILSYIIVALVFFSRMYLGVHTPLDVCTALLITIIVIWGLDHLKKFYSVPQGHKLGLLILSLTYTLGVYLYSYLLIRWNISTAELVSDAVIFASSLAGFSIGAYIENRYIHFRTQCFSIFMQLIKVILGLGGLLLINFGCSLLPFADIYTKSISCFLICLWALCIFPLFIKLVQKKTYSEL